MPMLLRRREYRLIEVVLLLVIIAIPCGILLVAIHPVRQIAESHNAQRESDLGAILDAVHRYSVDNQGALPKSITRFSTVVGNGDGQVDICADLVPTYIAAMPYDPNVEGAFYTDCANYNTAYTLSQDAKGHVTATAPGAELSQTISVTR